MEEKEVAPALEQDRLAPGGAARPVETLMGRGGGWEKSHFEEFNPVLKEGNGKDWVVWNQEGGRRKKVGWGCAGGRKEELGCVGAGWI